MAKICMTTFKSSHTFWHKDNLACAIFEENLIVLEVHTLECLYLAAKFLFQKYVNTLKWVIHLGVCCND
jgi:hypothetical protein